MAGRLPSRAPRAFYGGVGDVGGDGFGGEKLAVRMKKPLRWRLAVAHQRSSSPRRGKIKVAAGAERDKGIF
jgi:hypothetical protein